MLKYFSEIKPEQGKKLRWATGEINPLVVQLMAEAKEHIGNSQYKTVGWFVCPVLPSGDYDDSRVETIHPDDLVEEI